MDKTSSRVAQPVVPTAADPHHAQPAEPPAEEALARRRRRAVRAATTVFQVVVIAVVAINAAPSAWRARRDPVELAVVVAPCALLAGFFVCIHRAERLTMDSPPGERPRLLVAVLVLNTLFYCLVGYQAPQVLPVTVAVALVTMTPLLVLAGVYMLVFCKYQQYLEELDGVDRDTDAAGEGNAFKTARPADDSV